MRGITRSGWIGIASVVLVLATLGTILVVRSQRSRPSCGRGAVFVVRCGTQLVVDGKPFRFAGPNIYWLGLNGDGNYPPEFQVDDALAMAQAMGATVVRSHTLGISVGCPHCVEPDLGTFNQDALRHIDIAVAAAQRYHLHLIIPLVDNWHYYHGGKHTFTDWFNLPSEEHFFTDQVAIDAFKQYVQTILTHVNTITGVALRDDPTIMAWETGNELIPPPEWTKMITHFIKGLDPHHLVMDGRYGIDENVLNWPDIDIYSDHFYPMNIAEMQADAVQVHQAGKVFLIGEFGWSGGQGDPLPAFLDAARKSTAAGDLYWDLFAHGVAHGYTTPPDDSYGLIYPGTNSDMRAAAQLLRDHAYAMRGLRVPKNATPDAPLITAVTGKTVTWRGATPANTYTIERSTTGPDGPWATACTGCGAQDDTTWTDATRPTGTVWYRVQGVNLDGVAGPFSPAFETK